MFRARLGGPRLRALAIGAAALAVLAALGAGYVRWVARSPLPDGLIQANGRIEGDRITVGAKSAGRVRTLAVREGASVEPQQVLLVLDDTQADARVAQAKAALAQAIGRVGQASAAVTEGDAAVTRAVAFVGEARAQREHAQQALAAAEARVEAARSGLVVLRREVEIALTTAEAGFRQARAALTRARATELQTRRDAERYGSLADKGLIEPQRAEQADLEWIAAQSELIAAGDAVVQAEARIDDAQLGAGRVRVREDELRALDAQRAQQAAAVAQADAALGSAEVATSQARAVLDQARAGLRQAAAGRDQAEAAVAEAESVRGDLTIVAPSRGVVVTRIVDAGEVVGAGAPLLEIVDLDRLYLEVFVPETEVGRVRLGLPARVHVDAFPAEPYAATVRYIASRAEFTPKEVQTPDERVKLVYAVRLYLDRNPGHRLTPGLPADAVIRWKEETPWQPPRW